MYALKRTHIQAINPRCAKVSQPDPIIIFANLTALFCTRLKTLTWPSLYGSQHTAPYSSIGLTSAVLAKRSYYYFPSLVYTLWNEVPSMLSVVCNWHDLSSLDRCLQWQATTRKGSALLWQHRRGTASRNLTGQHILWQDRRGTASRNFAEQHTCQGTRGTVSRNFAGQHTCQDTRGKVSRNFAGKHTCQDTRGTVSRNLAGQHILWQDSRGTASRNW